MNLSAACLLAALAAWPARAEQKYYVNDFLNHGAGARPMALGEAMAADAADRSAGFYNPSGILGLGRRTVLLSHASLFNGMMDYSFASGVCPIGKDRALGLYVVRSSVDKIWDTRGFETDEAGRPIYSSDRLSYVENVDYAAGLTYAALFRERLRWGLTLKLITRRFDELTSIGTGVDAGVQFLAPGGVTAGLFSRNLTTSVNRYYADDWEIGLPEVYPGLGYRREVEYLYGGFALLYQFPNLLPTSGVSQGAFGGAFDPEGEAPSGNSPSDGLGKYLLSGNMGVEYHYMQRLFLWLGSNPLYMVTAGAGIRISRFEADLAFRRHLDLDDSYRLAVSWDF